MANLKEIRAKVASIKSTQKITRAMQMVAASKMRRAQERMAQQGGQVLHADYQARDNCAVAQLAVHIARQYGQGNTDVEVADKGKQHDGNDLQRDRHGALGIWHGRDPLSQQVKIGC